MSLPAIRCVGWSCIAIRVSRSGGGRVEAAHIPHTVVARRGTGAAVTAAAARVLSALERAAAEPTHLGRSAGKTLWGQREFRKHVRGSRGEA